MHTNSYNVYIDEAGDEGFKFECSLGRGSSKFFILAAIIVKQELDQKLASTVNDLKKFLNIKKKIFFHRSIFIKCHMKSEKYV